MILINGFSKPCVRALMIVALVLLFLRCGSSDEAGGPVGFSALFKDSQTTSLAAKGYSNDPPIKLTGHAGTAYTITVTEGGQWCFTSRRTGETTASGTLAATTDFVYIYLDGNETDAARRAELTVKFDGAEPILLTVDQAAYSLPETLDHAWAELPAYVEHSDFRYVTHYAPLSGSQTARNFTICYDRKKRIANWVAYPLHDCYMQGTYDRSDAWDFDPGIPPQDQANLRLGSYRGGVRGHQCMSNHRYVPYSELLNEQTFYSTNIMPQNYEFNGGSWLQMEGIASAQRCNDTLYIVTGTHGVRSYGSDKAGTSVAVPEYCWKVLLRTRSGKTGKRIDQFTSASELKAVGFWAENASSSQSGLKKYITSVSYIEQQTGYKFFTMLNDAIASEVKAQNNPSDWGIKR